MIKEQLFQYDISFDRDEKDPRFISLQVETLLRERFKVLVSKVEYEIVDGHLVRPRTKEPFINSIKRGRDLIQRLKYNPVDIDREDAEVIGFGDTIDPFMSDPNTPLGSKVLSISPKGDEGSKYEHNFYDIFILKELNGERYVELSRYSSALTRKDYAKRLGLDSQNPPTAAEFLAHPIRIRDVVITPEQIHEALHIDHEYMAPSDFEEVWKAVQPFVRRYVYNRDARSFNAIINFADEVCENKNRREIGQEYRDYKGYIPSYSEIRRLEERKVKQVSGYCPGKSGADINNSPFSVSDLANLEPDKYGERTFECPSCGKINIRSKDELVKECQHCGSADVAC